MAVELGIGDLFDRVERHLGKWPTKTLVFGAWLAAMAFFINTLYNYAIKPLLSVGPSASTALTWLDLIRIALAIFLGALVASHLIDAYRIKIMREEVEDLTGKARSTLDTIEDFGRSSRKEREDMIEDVKSLMRDAQDAASRAHEIQQTALLTAESMYEYANRGQPLGADELASLKGLLDDLKAQAEASNRAESALSRQIIKL